MPPLPDTGTPFVNNITCGCWLDGGNHSPPMMTTYNDAFDLKAECLADGITPKKGAALKKAQEKVAHLKSMMVKWKIDASQFVLLEPPVAHKLYCVESPTSIKAFLEYYMDKDKFHGRPPISKTTFVVHDAGGAYVENGQSVFDALGIQNRV